MKHIATVLVKHLTLWEISIPALVAVSVCIGFLAALVVPVTVR